MTGPGPIRIANAPCSWGVLEFDPPGKALGYAQVLDEIRDAGYEGTELGDWAFMPTDPSVLRDELTKRGLEMVGAFVPVAFANERAHEQGAAIAMRTANLLAGVHGNSPFLVLADDNGQDPNRTKKAGRIDAADALNENQWRTFARGVERVARAVRDQTGLRCVFHHHCAGFIETPAEITRLLDLTNPELVGLCFDTGHYTFGGGDALAGLQRHRDRIWHVHFKDCSPALHQRSRVEAWNYFESLKHGIFCELGKGQVDFAAILAELRRTGYTGWIVVEQDVLCGMGAPKDFAKRNRAYLQKLGV
ncbi:MAG: xylose isomerase [Verrucomicrobia bacterium]|nr:MAG: xylose isomerase [Verrucomicrobiota bacterium]